MILCRTSSSARPKKSGGRSGPAGRWWRSPHAVHARTTNAFSRDATLGLLAYFLSRPARHEGQGESLDGVGRWQHRDHACSSQGLQTDRYARWQDTYRGLGERRINA